MPIDPSAPEDSSRLPTSAWSSARSLGPENASPEQLIRADGVGACPLRERLERGARTDALAFYAYEQHRKPARGRSETAALV
jgi:hypothetical protein